jgi:SNF2 family DNA or RNA helicase
MDELRPALLSLLPPAPVFVSHELNIPLEGKTLAEGKLFRALTNQLTTVMDSAQVSALIKLELYMRIQQFLVHPQIYIESMRSKFKGAYPRPDWTGSATKYAAFSEELAASKEPTLIFCNFRTEMDRVIDTANGMGFRVWSIRGGMGSEAVGVAVAEARAAAASGVPVAVVVQIVAGGAGLNLQFCSRILFLSQHWNPAVVQQATGRAVRIGQKAVVRIHFFRVVDEVSDNIDRRMLILHSEKIAAARGICQSLFEGFDSSSLVE